MRVVKYRITSWTHRPKALCAKRRLHSVNWTCLNINKTIFKLHFKNKINYFMWANFSIQTVELVMRMRWEQILRRHNFTIRTCELDIQILMVVGFSFFTLDRGWWLVDFRRRFASNRAGSVSNWRQCSLGRAGPFHFLRHALSSGSTEFC